MRDLSKLDLKFKYRSNQDQIFKDFITPCIENSVSYRRAVGYFTSASLSLLSKGLESFISRNGSIKMICNPHLNEEDLYAIKEGKVAKYDLVKRKILEELEISANKIEDDTFNILSWLVFKDILEIRIAYTEDDSIYHEKFGIFTDEQGYSVSFSGSSNETFGGLFANFEKIDVYNQSAEPMRVSDAIDDFENLWNNKTNGLNVIDIYPEAVDFIHSNRSKTYLELQGTLPFDIRYYQREAVDCLVGNDWQGIFEMATGTGKTKTSLFAANEYYQTKNKVFLIIFVPFTHLVSQWAKECKGLGFKNIVECFGSKRSWIYDLESLVDRFNYDLIDKCVAISVYKSANKPEFIKTISKIRKHSFLIADECHYFGAVSYRHSGFESIKARLGLSATPHRWWDEEGTDHVLEYFNKVVFEYSLEQAIESGALSEYLYYPIIVSLNDDELSEYSDLTLKIARLINSKEKEDRDKAKQLMIQRMLIIKRCEQKKEKLYEILRDYPSEDKSHILVYCAPSEINDVSNLIHNLGYSVSRFDHMIPTKERESILDRFDRGNIQVLVAIKCLDEGVDIPSTKTAFFLASTSNPKEFIQRRGRVLRPSSNKQFAKIYDFVVMGLEGSQDVFWEVAKKELPRVAEFSDSAINQYVARKEIWEILKIHDLEYLLDKKSWEIYHEDREERKYDYGD